MDYNGLCTSLLLMKLSNGEYIPLPSVQASYGPFNSLDEAKNDLIDTFTSIENVPRGYTFCVIEEGKPQEYWFTKTGDWSTIEKKNVSSSSSSSEVVIKGVQFAVNNGYIQVSYDNGTTWSNLVSLESLRGYTGQKGDKGDKGEHGADADLTQLKLRLRTTSTEVDDETIVKQFLDMSYYGGADNTWITVGEILGSSSGGSSTPQVIGITTVDGNKYWTVNGEILIDDTGNPVRANGIDGRDGQDGTSTGAITSFTSIVFRRTNQDISNQRPTGGTYANPRPSGGQWYDGIPSGTEKVWMSQRRFFSLESMNDETAYPWSLPGQATDTADIDFEYSNAPLSTPSGTLRNPTTNPYSVSNPNGWYDGTEHNELLSGANWMAIRKLKNGAPATEPASTNGWQIFKIRGEDGTNGVTPTAHFKSLAFRRSDNYTLGIDNVPVLNSSELPTGGDYNNPVPTNVDGDNNPLWSDGIPQHSKEKLWETTCIFHSDGTSEGWTTPRVVADSEYMDYEYAEENPAYPKPMRRSPDDNNPDYPAGITDDGWDDEPDYTKDYVWRAERPIVGNKYAPNSDWLVIRIKGERGTDGTSVTIKGTLAAMYSTWDQAQADRSNRSIGDLIYVQNDDSSTSGTNEVGVYMYNGTTYSKITPSEGDGYLYSGDLWVWDGDSLVNVGPIQGPQGEPGKTYYLHIKYSNDGGNNFTSNNGEDPGDYIGTYVNEYSSSTAEDTMDPSKYKWQKWTGEDGFGYEYIFILTETDEAPSVPTDFTGDTNSANKSYQDDDYVPDGWTDDPQSPYKAMPYCWVAYRKKVDGLWTRYIGQSTDKTKAALFSMYSSRGRGIEDITELYAVGTSKEEAPALSEFGQDIPTFNPAQGLIYLWNYEIISYDDDSESKITTPACIGAYIEGKGLGQIVEYYYAAASDDINLLPNWRTATPDAVWSKTPLKVDKDKPYLWNYEVVFFDDDTLCQINEPVIIAYYTYTDIEYLTNIFEKVEGNSNYAYLGGLIGVTEKDDDDNDVVRAALNATNEGSNEHGKLFIASGMNGVNDMDNATFKVYEDGHVEMHDALIQGFLQQYYKNQQSVEKSTYAYSSWANNIQIDPSKASNQILLAWEGLLNPDRYALVLSDATNNSLYPGRIVLSNVWYIAENGTVYYNSRNKKTIVKGNFLLKNGLVYNGATIVLTGGWIELSKLASLNSNNKEVTITNSTLQEIYVLHDWGGNISISFDTVFSPQLNNNQAVIGFVQNPSLEISRFIGTTEVYARIYPSNKYITINSGGNEETLYIVMPQYNFNNVYGAVSTDATKEISYIFKIPHNHRAVKFKVEMLGENTPDNEIENLEDLMVAPYSPITIENTGSSPTSFETIYFKLTYIPHSDITIAAHWILEKINPVASID